MVLRHKRAGPARDAFVLYSALYFTSVVASDIVEGDSKSCGVPGDAAAERRASCSGGGGAAAAAPGGSVRTWSLVQLNSVTKREALTQELYDLEEDDALHPKRHGEHPVGAGASADAEPLLVEQKASRKKPLAEAAVASSAPRSPAPRAVLAAAAASAEASAAEAPSEPPRQPPPAPEPPLSSLAGAAESTAEPLRTASESLARGASSLRLRLAELVRGLSGTHKQSLLLVQFTDGGFDPKVLALAIILGSLFLCASVLILRAYHADRSSPAAQHRLNNPLMADAFTCPKQVQAKCITEARSPTPRRLSLQPQPVPRPQAPTPQLGSAAATPPTPPPADEDSATGVSDQRKPAEPDYFFCRDLIVPPTCECILKVPIQPVGKGSFNVTDLNDNMVLRIEPRTAQTRSSIVGAFSSAGGREPAEGSHRLVLMTSFGNILAQCGPAVPRSSEAPSQAECFRASTTSRAPPEFHLLKGSGELFAKLTRTDLQEQQYTLIDKTGKRLYFWGDLENYSINVSGESRKLVARTEVVPESAVDGRPGCYKVQVAPLMDVGLVLCGLLCIDRLAA